MHPTDVYFYPDCQGSMVKRLAHAHVGIMQLHIFTHQGDVDHWLGFAHICHDLFPGGPIWLATGGQAQPPEHIISQAEPF